MSQCLPWSGVAPQLNTLFAKMIVQLKPPARVSSTNRELMQLYWTHLMLTYAPSFASRQLKSPRPPHPVSFLQSSPAIFAAARKCASSQRVILSRFQQHVCHVLQEMGQTPIQEYMTGARPCCVHADHCCTRPWFCVLAAEKILIDFAWPECKWAMELDGPSHFLMGTASRWSPSAPTLTVWCACDQAQTPPPHKPR